MTDVRLQGQLLGGPREMHGTPNGDHQAAARPQTGVGLIDTWEFTPPEEYAYFPIRGGLILEGHVIRISASRWVSIGMSTNFLSLGIETAESLDADPVGDANRLWRYGATLWEDQFDGELRIIEQVQLFGTYDSAAVHIDTVDGVNWLCCGVRRHGSLGVGVPMWSTRRLTIDMSTGALSVGPLVTITYPGATSGIPGGDEFGFAAVSSGQGLLVASVGDTNLGGSGHVYAQAVNLDSGTLGAYTKKYPADFGWIPAPSTVGSTFDVTAKSISSGDVLAIIIPRNVESIPSPHYQVIEAHYNGSADLLSAETLVYIPYPGSGALVGVPIQKPQLNLLFVALVTIGTDNFNCYGWVNGVRQVLPELEGIGVGGWFVGDRLAYRYVGWYQNDNYPAGTVVQYMEVDGDVGWIDFDLRRYPGPTVLLDLERVGKREFWFNTYTQYPSEDMESEFWRLNIGDYVDASPGQRFFQYIWMLDTNLWCGVHQDTSGEW